MMTYGTVSGDLKRMTQEDAIFGKGGPSLRKEPEENLEMDALLEHEFVAFKEGLQDAMQKYGEEFALDAYVEEVFNFWSELAEGIAKWIKRLPDDTAFQRGCSHTLAQVKVLLDRIEALRPPEPP